MRRLFQYEQFSGLLMIGVMLLALALANSPLEPLYHLVHHTPVMVRVGVLSIDKTLVQWINEGLMVFFFLLVGLEIKRQVLEGQLSTLPQFALPALAALGGMIVPAAVYLVIAGADPVLRPGWAIPTATDIVLALGILSLLGKRVPASLKIFLTALAVFDDIGAVLIIGFFYSDDISQTALVLAASAALGLAILNALNVTRTAPYVLVGTFLWIALLKSGVHPTLAGVVIGLAIPMRITGAHGVVSPLRKMEQQLHGWVTLGVVPLFAFFNSGIVLGNVVADSLIAPLSLGVILGLLVGKQLGVFGAVWLAWRLRVADLPEGANLAQLYGIAALAGIGFTMSLFVATLAFSDTQLLISAKAAILIGSGLSAVIGLVILYQATRQPTPTPKPAGAET